MRFLAKSPGANGLKLKYSSLPGEKVWCQGQLGTAIAKPRYI